MRRWATWGAALAVATCCTWQSASAQTGRPVRVVVVDSSGVPLPDALVSWMRSGVHGRSGPDGIARFDGVAFGPEILAVRRLGYRRITAPIAIDTLEPEEVRIVLQRSVTVLRGVSVEDTAGRPWLSEFDERRRRGLGHFVTIDQINKAHGATLAAVLARVPGIRVGGPNPYAQYIFSTRGPNSFGSNDCQAAVYIDGIREFKGNAAEVPVMMLGGIEFYGPNQVPVEYKDPAPVGVKGGAQGGTPACGVLLMWTR